MFVVNGTRAIFKIFPVGGKLVGKREVECAFASGESLHPATEETIFTCAGKAKDWEGLIFKLRLEGYDVVDKEAFKLPFGKL